MTTSSSWIKEWLRRTMLSDQKVVEALERAGIEVEQVISSKEIDKRVVVALVKKVVQHPGADRLHLVDVEKGGGENFRVVCGAPNVREGMKVALAQIGAVLPGGDRIEKAKLRGEVSEGMLCSERELELGNDHNGIMEVSSDVAVGTPLCDIYPADTLIDIKTPANRFDVQSVVGLAREVSAMTDAELAPLSPPAVKISADGPAVKPGGAARRYMLARITVDQSSPSPRQMAARLRAAGMRPISPVVDVTNYVMLEMGQPLHAFDAAKVKLPVEVRYAEAGELLTTLDGVERKLAPEDLVIADAAGPIALAGLMGGANSEVGPETTEILLEAATFDGATVRKMAKRHGLRTEASARFERGIPVDLTPLALGRALELLGGAAAGELVSATDQQNERPRKASITLSSSRLSRLLGFGISPKEVIAALEKLQISAKLHKSVGESHKEELVEIAEVPWWRPDLELAEDLAEEIVRVVGYDKVPSTIPSWRPRRLEFDRIRSKRRRVRDVMYGAGLFDVVTYSFVSPEQLVQTGAEPAVHLKLKNPLSAEQAYLRSTLLPSHLSVLERNRTYVREAGGVGFYEISQVFLKRGNGEQPDEPQRLAITMQQPERAFAKVKGVLDVLAWELNLELQVEPEDAPVFAPGRAGVVVLNGRKLGMIGQVHPERLQALKTDDEVAYVELDLAPLLEAASARGFAGLERFPVMARDLAVVLPANVTWQVVKDELSGMNVAFVDEYYGAGLPEGHKSLTLRLTVAHPDRTPTEAEAAEAEAKVLRRLERKLGAKARA